MANVVSHTTVTLTAAEIAEALIEKAAESADFANLDTLVIKHNGTAIVASDLEVVVSDQ